MSNLYLNHIDIEGKDDKTLKELAKYMEWKNKIIEHKYYILLEMDEFCETSIGNEPPYDNILGRIQTKDTLTLVSRMYPKYKDIFEKAFRENQAKYY